MAVQCAQPHERRGADRPEQRSARGIRGESGGWAGTCACHPATARGQLAPSGITYGTLLQSDRRMRFPRQRLRPGLGRTTTRSGGSDGGEQRRLSSGSDREAHLRTSRSGRDRHHTASGERSASRSRPATARSLTRWEPLTATKRRNLRRDAKYLIQRSRREKRQYQRGDADGARR